MTDLEAFASLQRADRDTNAGRKADSDTIREELSALIGSWTTAELLQLLQRGGLVATPVNAIADVRELPGIKEHLTSTQLPDGGEVRLPPTAVETERKQYPLAPCYGEHTRQILNEAGLAAEEIDDLQKRGVVH